MAAARGKSWKAPKAFLIIVSVMSAAFAVLLSTLAQAPPAQATPVSTARIDLENTPPPELRAPAQHRFWDWPNVALFSGVAASRAFDYLSTRKFRDKHLREWLLDDGTVDNRPLFAGIELAGTALSIGVSYAFHRAGYHRVERWASIVHIAFATAGGIWNCTLPNGL